MTYLLLHDIMLGIVVCLSSLLKFILEQKTMCNRFFVGIFILFNPFRTHVHVLKVDLFYLNLDCTVAASIFRHHNQQ